MFVKDNGEGNEHLKLIDFGSSMLLQGGKTYRFKSLALDSDIGYRSPEHKMNTGIRGYMFTTRTDIWALGVILFKLVSNDDNVKLFDEEFIPSEGNKDILQQEIMEKVDEKEKELKNKKMEPLFNVIRLCLYFDPNDRPSAENLIAFMKNECTMKLPNGKQISFNPEIAPPKDECNVSRVTREPAVLKTRRLFIQSKSKLSPRTTI
uniref:Protein kinase domain-containing protein n=1 Tax=Meloidogyne enterolobii TaxID=390850 RepID=A0A6V7V1K2_MELEN|nr:unnamed protein product [Meloidogyne enterolobii]